MTKDFKVPIQVYKTNNTLNSTEGCSFKTIFGLKVQFKYQNLQNIQIRKIFNWDFQNQSWLIIWAREWYFRICTSNHMFGKAIWDKLLEWNFENFETARVKRKQFQNFQKSLIYPKSLPKHSCDYQLMAPNQ